MVMGLVGAGLGVAAPLIANKLGIGKNDTRATTFNETSAYDPHAFQYGGSAGAANATANRYATMADQAQQRTAAQAGIAYVNPSVSNAWMTNNAQDRTQQNQVARMMMARAQGLVPSIASQQAALDMQRAGAAQSSAAASARGAAGLALAGQNAANNTATMQSAISNNAQINAANERMAAEQNAFGAYSGIRGGDAQMQAQAAQQAQYNAQLAAQQNQFNAGLAQQQHGLNDAYSLGLYGQENNVRALQLQGGMNGQQMLNGSHMNATNQNVAISGANANREYEYYQQALGAFQGGLTGSTQMAAAAPPPPPPIQPATGVGAPTSGTGGASTNMVGVPVASDDRMKMGMSPLGLLGVFGGGNGGNMNPTSGPGASSYEVLSGGGENVAASGQAMNNVATAYQQDPTSYSGAPGAHTSMMSQGLLSDDRAKLRAYYIQGRQDGAMQARDDDPVPYADGIAPLRPSDEEFVVSRGRPEIRPTLAATSRELDQAVRAAAAARAQGGGLDRDAQYVSPTRSPSPATSGGGPGVGVSIDRDESYMPATAAPPPRPVPHASAGDDADARGNMFARAAALAAVSPVQNAGLLAFLGSNALGARAAGSALRAKEPSTDPVTEQLATGLAPIRFQYKPGMGPAGEQTGVRAQAAASQPITASMVQRRPDGLLQIDPQMGLSTALAASGHLAQKQQEQERKLNGLLALAARREGY